MFNSSFYFLDVPMAVELLAIIKPLMYNLTGSPDSL